jgi:hypothetical protein
MTGFFIIAIVLSLVILLLDHPVKYVLYIFGLSLTGILFLITDRCDYKFKLSMPFSFNVVDYFFIACSIGVLASNIFANPIMNISFILSVIVTFFLPGWVLLRLLEIDRVMKFNVMLLVLSFAVSIGFSSLIFTFTLLFKTSTASIFLSIIYTSISSLPLLKDHLYKSSKKNQKQQSSYSSNNEREYNLFDVLLLVWISLFFIFIISNLYPQMAYIPGYDIVRHFSKSKELILAPDVYGSKYPWFHFTWASVMELSGPPMWLFQSGIVWLSIMLIYSFYTMAKTYLSDIDKRAPILATVFFSVFAGFGWFYFIKKVLNIPNLSEYYHILSMSVNASYLDIGYGQGSWLWLWFLPWTLGFTIFFVLLCLLRRKDLTGHKYTIITSLLILTLSQVHFSELIIFVVFLFVLALFFPAINLRLKETVISVLIGLAASALLTATYQNVLSSGYLLSSNEYLLVLAVLGTLGFILVRYPSRPKISFRIDLTLITSIAFFVYSVFIFYWFSNSDTFLLNNINKIGAVPWEFYPMLLGIVGVFAIPGFVLVAKKFRNHPIIIFTALLVFAIVFGRIVTYVNASLVSTDYWERRLIPFVYVSCSLLAPVIVLRLIEQIKQKQKMVTGLKALKNTLTATFLSFLVLGGILSPFLTVEYHILNKAKVGPTNNEINIQRSLNTIGQCSYCITPYSTVLTVGDRSKSIAEYGSSGYIVGYYKYQIWPSASPELPLNVLYALNSSAIIYLNQQDLKEITKNKYGNGYIASHLLKLAPASLREGSAGGLFQIPRQTPPSSKSDIVLVLPVDSGNKFYYYSYDILSQAGYNYTTVLLSDINSIRKARVVVTPSEEIALKVMKYKNEYNLKFEKLIVLNLDGYGQLMDVSSTKSSPLFDGVGNASAQWIANGFGSGKIGIPKLRYNPDITSSGKNSLEISVGGGKYGLWRITMPLYDKPINLTKFDFAKFNWYGRGDGKWYALKFTGPGPRDHSLYKFNDSWSGWREVILPMKMSDGRGYTSGVTFDKLTTLRASWSKIIRIDLQTETTTPNQEEKFYLDEFAFIGNTLHSSSIKSDSNKKEIQFPTYIGLNPITPRLNNYNAIAYYNVGVPFIIHKTYNGYDMFYINVNPIIQKLNSKNNDARHIYPLLGKLLELVNTKQLAPYKFVDRSKATASLITGGVTAFNNATFNGDLTLKSSSAIISVNTPSIRVNNDRKDLTLSDVSEIIPINNENVTIRSNMGIINGGSGFYTHVLLNQSLVHFTGHPAILSLTFKDGSTNIIVGKEIQINLAKSNILLRQPTVVSNGIINFINFYSYGELNNRLRTLGQDLQIEGRVSFNSIYSDNFTITRGTWLEGKLERSQPTYPYDELGSLAKIFILPNTLQYIVTLLMIYLIFSIYILKKKKIAYTGSPFKTRWTNSWQ